VSCITSAPPDLANDLLNRGLYLAGGGALLTGFGRAARSATGIPVHLVENPERCAVAGAVSCMATMGHTADLSVVAGGDAEQVLSCLTNLPVPVRKAAAEAHRLGLSIAASAILPGEDLGLSSNPARSREGPREADSPECRTADSRQRASVWVEAMRTRAGRANASDTSPTAKHAPRPQIGPDPPAELRSPHPAGRLPSHMRVCGFWDRGPRELPRSLQLSRVHPHEAPSALARTSGSASPRNDRAACCLQHAGVSRVAPAARRVDRRLPTVLGHLRRPRACEPWQATARWIR